MVNKKQVTGIVLGLLVLVALGFLIALSPTLNKFVVGDFTGHSRVVPGGERVEIKASWTDNEDFGSDCRLNIKDVTPENGAFTVEQTFGPKCNENVNLGLEMNIFDLDMTKYEKVIVRRGWSAEACAERLQYIQSEVNGLTFETVDAGVNPDTCINTGGGDIVIENNKEEITVSYIGSQLESTTVYEYTDSFSLKNKMRVGAPIFADDRKLTLNYKIKRVDKFPFPDPVNETVEEDETPIEEDTDQEEPAEEEPAANAPEEEKGFFARIIDWILGWFK